MLAPSSPPLYGAGKLNRGRCNSIPFITAVVTWQLWGREI